MHDYRLDEREQPEPHPDAVKRLTEPPQRTVSSAGGELPGLLSRSPNLIKAALGA